MDWGDLTCTVEMDWWGFGWDSGPFAGLATGSLALRGKLGPLEKTTKHTLGVRIAVGPA